MWQYLLVVFSLVWGWDLLLLPCEEGRGQKVGWFKCPCRSSSSASALHNQSLCASEEGSGTEYTEKKFYCWNCGMSCNVLCISLRG